VIISHVWDVRLKKIQATAHITVINIMLKLKWSESNMNDFEIAVTVNVVLLIMGLYLFYKSVKDGKQQTE
jgi:hypothetical protein